MIGRTKCQECGDYHFNWEPHRRGPGDKHPAMIRGIVAIWDVAVILVCLGAAFVSMMVIITGFGIIPGIVGLVVSLLILRGSHAGQKARKEAAKKEYFQKLEWQQEWERTHQR
jgi:hypothetical protein